MFVLWITLIRSEEYYPQLLTCLRPLVEKNGDEKHVDRSGYSHCLMWAYSQSRSWRSPKQRVATATVMAQPRRDPEWWKRRARSVPRRLPLATASATVELPIIEHM